MSRISWRIHVWILVAYVSLALLLTWPLVTRMGTHVPGNGVDDPPLTWNLWWVQHALLDLRTNPFDCDYLFYPLGINLAFYTLTLLNGLLSIPLQAAFGLVPASNLLLLSSFTLSGYGTFLLASYLLGERVTQKGVGSKETPTGKGSVSTSGLLAAFVAGLFYAFASSKMAYAALGQWNIASSQWIPFYALYLCRMGVDPQKWRSAFMAALFFLLQAYAELTYAAFLVLFTLFWAVVEGLSTCRSRGLAGIWRLAARVGLLGLVCAIGLTPILANVIPDMVAEGDIFAEAEGFADVFSADLLGFLVPTMYHPLFGRFVKEYRFDYSVGQHIYVGYSVLIILVAGILHWRRRHLTPSAGSPLEYSARPVGGQTRRSPRTTFRCRVWFWTSSALIFWVLTLGPRLRINGQDTGLPLPYALLAQIPFLKGNRYPSRFSVLLVLSLSVLIAYSLAAIAERTRTRRVRFVLPLLLSTLILFEHLSVPLHLSDMRVPPIYQTIADRMPGDLTLLDLPVAWRNGFRVTGTQHPIIMFQQFYQSVHRKRLLAGNTSRNPPLKFQYFAEAPVIRTLIALETGHAVDAAVMEQDRVLAAQVLRFFNIEAIVVHPAQAGPSMTSYIETTMPVQRIYENAQISAYAVELPPWPESWRIEPGEELGRLSLAEGWGVPAEGVVWGQRRRVRLLVPLNGQGQRMAFRAFAPENGQRLSVEINGRPVHWIGMAAGWMDYQLELPSDAVDPGLNEIWLLFDTLYSASDIRLASRLIGQTGAESPVHLVVQSAGQEVGDFSHMYVNGRDASPNERGYNVVILDPVSGTVEQSAAFDTHMDPAASQALAAFLSGIPPGHIVAVSAADEASRLLSQEAIDALRAIGATVDLRDRFRWGHAIIGVQGASPGAALESLDWIQPVTLAVGEGATEPTLAAAFSTFTFTAVDSHPAPSVSP